MSGFSELRYEVADGIATLTLDRPDARNAFTQVMAGELAAAAGRPTSTTTSASSW